MTSNVTLVLGLCFAVLSLFFYKYLDNVDIKPERGIIDSWTNFIKPPEKQFQKLAVGINSNVDIIVSGVALLNALKILPGKRENKNVLSNFNDLQETFAFYFARGSAAERPFTDQPIYQKIIETAETLNHVEHFIGGNAALMAKKASSLFPSLSINFVGPVGPLLERLMPKAVKIPPTCRIPKDEVHLIMEYKVGEQWGNLSAPVANRFITSHDESNSKIVMLEAYFESIKTFQPDLILLSGLNIMDGQSPEFFDERLEKMVSLLQDVPSSVPVHLELASMANEDFVRQIIEEVLPHGVSSLGLNEQELALVARVGGWSNHAPVPLSDQKALPNVDSLGLNEQEIVFSSKSLNGPHHDHFDDYNGQPEIYKISDIMLWILQKYGKSSNHPSSRLSRIHFHSLTYHIVGVRDTAWSNVDKATAAGTQVAGLQACDIPNLKEDLVELKIPSRFKLFSGDKEKDFDPHNPVISWRRDDFFFVFSPVLVCRHPVKTVGLGDAISATGLMYSQFHS
ncbi:unnamed protein product [Lymnaea stagnalis]|uniref:ADP-dependent glucokinase n=1 Tax=Lymnaea stagnalis TaxID=6523 RepID=A0AAV2HPL5_LYMST